MKNILSLGLLCLLISGCGPAMKVAKIDSSTGLIQPQGAMLGKATVVKSVKIPLAKYKEMVFFTASSYQYEFGTNQLKEIGYFDQIMKYSDLEKIVVANNLQDKIISLDNQIGLSRLAHNYKPFLWIELSVGNKNGEGYAKLQVRNVENAEDVFEATTSLSLGTSDETVWYPLFNELITWINQNR